MKRRIISRIVSAVILGVLFACAVHFDHLERGKMGREEFLIKEAARFDRHFARSGPIAMEFFVGVLMAGGLVAGYELVAFGASKILARINARNSNS